MTDELSGRDLDEALAKAIGWYYQLPDRLSDQAPFVYAQSWAQAEKKISGSLGPPPFHESLDALRDGPESLLREAEYWMVVDSIDGPFSVEWWANRAPRVIVKADDETTARARAALLSLTAIAAIGPTASGWMPEGVDRRSAAAGAGMQNPAAPTVEQAVVEAARALDTCEDFGMHEVGCWADSANPCTCYLTDIHAALFPALAGRTSGGDADA